MILSPLPLFCLLLVVSIFDDVAESKAASQLQSDVDVSMESWEEAGIGLETASGLVKQAANLTNLEAADKPHTASDDWFGTCSNLTDDLEKSWNLTVRIASRTGSVLWDMGGALYDLINCNASVLLPIKCIYRNLERLRKIIDPAVVDAYGFAKEGIKLVPVVIRDTKRCCNF